MGFSTAMTKETQCRWVRGGGGWVRGGLGGLIRSDMFSIDKTDLYKKRIQILKCQHNKIGSLFSRLQCFESENILLMGLFI